MVTAKQVKDLGFEFVEGDIITVNGTDLYAAVVAQYSDYIEIDSIPSDAVVKEFCYRWHNFNDMPCNGELRVDALSKQMAFEGVMASELDWTDVVSERIVRWRPSMKNWESEEIPTETPEEKEALDLLSVVKEFPVVELTDLQAKITAAVKTLESRGYTWNGGEQWKPPLGEKPKWLETETAYEKVEDSIFDLKGEFERGELFKMRFGTYQKITCLLELSRGYADSFVYRKVEKPIDWDAKAREYLDKYHTNEKIAWTVGGWSLDMQGMIGLCHLIAELTPKPTKQCD